MPTLVTIAGPIASGKSTVAAFLAQRCSREGRTVVIADVDDVAAMVAEPGPLKLVCGSRLMKCTVRW
jgi:dephospho-CoA kinase